MKLEDVKKGMKVVPHDKSVEGWDGLSDSRVWKRAKEKGQEFLYVSSIDHTIGEKESVVVLDEELDNPGGDFFYASDIEPYEPTKEKTYEVDEDFIKAAYEAAPSKWKDRLRDKFPELLNRKEEDLFEFGLSFSLDTRFSADSPIGIGNRLVGSEERGKCLLVDSQYDVVVEQTNGTWTKIKLVKRK